VSEYLVQYAAYPEEQSQDNEWSLEAIVVSAKSARRAEEAAIRGFQEHRGVRTPIYVWKTEKIPVALKAFSVLDKYGSFAVVSSRNAEMARREAAKDLGVSPQSIISVQEVTKMARRKNPSSAMNAGRRKRRERMGIPTLPPMETYAPPASYLLSKSASELAAMGTPEAQAELVRRERDPITGNKRSWGKASTTPAEREAKRKSTPKSNPRKRGSWTKAKSKTDDALIEALADKAGALERIDNLPEFKTLRRRGRTAEDIEAAVTNVFVLKYVMDDDSYASRNNPLEHVTSGGFFHRPIDLLPYRWSDGTVRPASNYDFSYGRAVLTKYKRVSPQAWKISFELDGEPVEGFFARHGELWSGAMDSTVPEWVEAAMKASGKDNPSSAMNAGRRKRRQRMGIPTLPPMDPYSPPASYLLTQSAHELVEMGTPEAQAELIRRERDPITGNKKSWGKAATSPGERAAKRAAKPNGWNW